MERFAEDIRRHLHDFPVIARKDTTRYRTAKFVVRHKTGVIAAAMVAAVLIAGVIITLQQARIARRRFNDVRALANSLIFDVHDSIKDLPGATPARKIIVARALQYLDVLAHESAGDVQLQRELATAYERVGVVQGDYLEHNLGDAEGALASYKRALDLRKYIATVSRDWSDQLALAQGYRLVAHQMWANGDLALTAAEPLISTDPADLDALYAAADAYSGLGDLNMTRARSPGLTTKARKSNWIDARSWFQLSLNTWHRIKRPNHSAPNSFQVGDPTLVAEELRRVEADLSSAR